ncbi:MAG: hypothetical protein HYY44_09830, partial [Deltaproteobacteria bacterium]|nr:hypothetical protein [Deltaproteobacteria bacterium]
MKKWGLLFLVLLPAHGFFLAEAQAQAINLRNVVRNLATIPLPPNCRQETVRSSGSDPVINANSKRYVCTGRWWGATAMDVSCDPDQLTSGTGSLQIEYRRCHVRHPSLVNAVESWIDISFPFSGPWMHYHSDEIESIAGSEVSYWGSWESLVPDLLADEEEASVPFTDNERTAVVSLLDQVGTSMTLALSEENPDFVGPPDSEFRVYVQLAYLSVLYTLHGIAPSLYSCPPLLQGLCTLVPQTSLVWQTTGELAQTLGLNSIRVHPQFMIEARTNPDRSGNPNMAPVVAALLSHEFTHVLNFFTGRLGGTFNPQT